jgi:hypothetical protein
MCITGGPRTQTGSAGWIAALRKWLHHPGRMRKDCSMNRRTFSEESKKKLWRPCREARALGL